ncbi:MAG: DUF3592 domain-containing protein [Deltaproteobacteria bacterium]|nr:DUF3592 domain-containing protein [Deltaproteobacteria bacterium]
MSALIHPDLAGNQQLSRFVALLLSFLVFLLTVIGGLGLVVAFMDMRFIWMGLMLPLVSFPGARLLCLFYKKWKLSESEKLNWGSRLLYETRPCPMRMLFKNVIGWRGPLVEFEDPDSQLYLAGALQTTKFNYPEKKETQVEVFYQADNPYLLYLRKKKSGRKKLVFVSLYNRENIERERQLLKKVFIAFFFVLVMIFAAAKTYMFIELWQSRQELSRARLSLHWPAVTGKILRSDIRQWSCKNRSGQQIPYYAVDLEYSYMVAHHLHQGHRLRFGYRGESRRDKIESQLQRCSAGTEVEVYYNPQDPAEAVLEPGNLAAIQRKITGAWGGLISMAVAALITLGLVWIFLVRRCSREFERVRQRLVAN